MDSPQRGAWRPCLPFNTRNEALHIEVRGIPAERIYACTFTNKAAEEVAERLNRHGSTVSGVLRSTIHRFCVDTLREFGTRVNAPEGIGIADEDYHALHGRASRSP